MTASASPGGEPTLHKDLPAFAEQIRALGFAVKLDTNGYRPDVLRGMVEAGLVDYAAMDIKNSRAKYAEACGWTSPTSPRLSKAPRS